MANSDTTKGTGRLVHLRVKRQDGPDLPDTKRWEEFKVPYLPQMNIISALQQVQKEPRTVEGKSVAPVVWESSCLEEVCGACTMIINGRVRQACSALVDQIAPNGEVIEVEPMTKFPLVRDLQVDRSVLFENLKAVKAWVPLDGTYDLGSGPRVFPQVQEANYPLSNCISCTCCMEVCPQFNDVTGFVGAATIAQVKLFNNHPTGKVLKEERLRALAGDGGVQECGYAQNCVEVCPKQIPLTTAISDVSRDVFVQKAKDLLRG